MFIIRHTGVFVGISIAVMAVALISIGVFGLNFGIDFTGGTLIEVDYADGRPSAELLSDELGFNGFTGALIQPTGDTGVIVKLAEVRDSDRPSLLRAIGNLGSFTEVRYTSIGPVIGEELREKGAYAIVFVVALIIAYIAFVFRKVSKPVSSWKYGVAAVLALVHDILIPTGLFAILGFEIDSLYLTAMLAILGLSVNDTIVVFDRLRENLAGRSTAAFSEVVGKSLNQTMLRSFNTSLTTAVVLSALLIFGSESVRLFSLALLIGMIAGTYSSLFFASPLLVWWNDPRLSGDTTFRLRKNGAV